MTAIGWPCQIVEIAGQYRFRQYISELLLMSESAASFQLPGMIG
jgi:hypothetical protein